MFKFIAIKREKRLTTFPIKEVWIGMRFKYQDSHSHKWREAEISFKYKEDPIPTFEDTKGGTWTEDFLIEKINNGIYTLIT